MTQGMPRYAIGRHILQLRNPEGQLNETNLLKLCRWFNLHLGYNAIKGVCIPGIWMGIASLGFGSESEMVASALETVSIVQRSQPLVSCVFVDILADNSPEHGLPSFHRVEFESYVCSEAVILWHAFYQL